MKRIFLCCLLCLFLPLSAAAGEYVIAEGDKLNISVWDEPKLSTSATVRPDGKITIPGLRDVQAAGLTPMGLTDALEQQMASMVQNPIVTVIVREIAPLRLFVFGGGVKTQSPLNMHPQSTLLQALASLGQSDGADFSRAYLMRDGTIIKEDLPALLLEGDASRDVTLKSNDVLFVPRLKDRNVYVLGAVEGPTYIPYRSGLTFLEAVLEAGGFTPLARENRSFVVRMQGDEELTIPVRGKDLLQGDRTQNIDLQPGDYVIIREGLF